MFLRFLYVFISVITLSNLPVYAVEIIVGPGRGIIWSGNPFNLNVTGTHGYLQHTYYLGLGNLYSGGSCYQASAVELVDEGFYGYKVTTGIYIAPRGHVSGQLFYGMKQNDPTSASNHILSGTIGYPETKVIDQNGTEWEVPNAWCPKLSTVYPVAGKNKEINLSGDWIIYADGTQVPSATPYKLKNNFQGLIRSSAASAEGSDTGNTQLSQILLSEISVRVIGVQCNINTQINVNFGDILYDAKQNSELASVTSPFSVTCTQGSIPTTVNINASFRANTGYYNGDSTQLALTEGGGYITGEIGKGVTGSGACVSHPSSISFDQIPIKLATFPSTESSVDENNTITWRLCSGGADLPVGSINATTELSIVFS
ncbi:hypothetical protein HPS26_23125 [Klebsiella aerogenes]|uniref:hypothetical protein n=1 Tax=Klebsiella aerogenes TaxID=548 RepID=UPI00149523B4|nr:hypothetical protein [Klebsiella aerogenes]NPD52879.1 hypothetical protein [Klebsiella aerogenes]NPD80063.1 hypothetical protein [Klebsiella aerogenes]